MTVLVQQHSWSYSTIHGLCDTLSNASKSMHDYLPPLRAVFFSVFDNLSGAKLVDEVPDGSVSQPLDGGLSLFELSSDYVIPKQELCGHLITICLQRHKILGFPVFLQADIYDRRLFVFNVSFVFDRDAELAAYEPLVRKTGRVLRALEESSFLLSHSERRVRMHSVIEQLYEDLNSYSETCINLSGVHRLDLRLFPIFPNPPTVMEWDVPVLLVNLEQLQDDSWDLTLVRLMPFIDGTKSVKMIAKQADVDINLAKECFQHLLYYSCIILLDLFQYSNSYTLISGPSSLAELSGEPPEEGVDPGLECSAYVSISPDHKVSSATLLRLYTKLEPGLSVSQWMDENAVEELGIDVRRMMSFGVIKGFLRRCYCYPVWMEHPSFQLQPRGRPRNGLTNGHSLSPIKKKQDLPLARDIPRSLPALLDGKHHTDELCLKYKTGFTGLVQMLRSLAGTEEEEGTSKTDLGSVKLLYL